MVSRAWGASPHFMLSWKHQFHSSHTQVKVTLLEGPRTQVYILNRYHIFRKTFLFMCMCMCEFLSYTCRCPKRPEEGIEAREAGVPDACKLPQVDWMLESYLRCSQTLESPASASWVLGFQAAEWTKNRIKSLYWEAMREPCILTLWVIGKRKTQIPCRF